MLTTVAENRHTHRTKNEKAKIMWRFSAFLNDREPPIFFLTLVKNFTVAVLGI
jgi:hypothetical protein